MIFDVTAIGVLISLLMNSINLVIVVKNMLSAGEKKLEERVVKVEVKLIEHDRRIQAIENKFEHLPNKDGQHRIELGMAEINGRINVITERLEPLAAVTVRLQNYLIDQGKPS